MDNPRPEKVALVGEVRDRLSGSSAALLTEYRGLKVGELAELRRALRQAGGDYKIYKNTLVRFAVRELGLDELVGMLDGPTAIAFVEGDAAEVAKALRDFGRAHPSLVVKGGVLGQSILTPAQAAALSELPSRDVLLGRLAGALAAPMTQMAGLLQALPRNFAYGLKALIDQQGGPPEPAEPEEAKEPEAPEAAEPEEAKEPEAPEAAEPGPGAPPTPTPPDAGEARAEEAAET
ncbi:MAG: 50S ribosomal protein L10 [Acidimicrobiales bacterium]